MSDDEPRSRAGQGVVAAGVLAMLVAPLRMCASMGDDVARLASHAGPAVSGVADDVGRVGAIGTGLEVSSLAPLAP